MLPYHLLGEPFQQPLISFGKYTVDEHKIMHLLNYDFLFLEGGLPGQTVGRST